MTINLELIEMMSQASKTESFPDCWVKTLNDVSTVRFFYSGSTGCTYRSRTAAKKFNNNKLQNWGCKGSCESPQGPEQCKKEFFTKLKEKLS